VIDEIISERQARCWPQALSNAVGSIATAAVLIAFAIILFRGCESERDRTLQRSLHGAKP
jgi:hypothetical protein